MVFRVKEPALGLIREQVLRTNELLMGVIAESGKARFLICTDNRIVFYKMKFFGFDAESIPLDHINYVGFSQGWFSGSITVSTSSVEREFDCDKGDGALMNEIISNQMVIYKALSVGATVPRPDPKMELQLMYVRGHIPEDEYFRRMMLL